MMITVEKLKDFGADTEQGLSRCCSNEPMYLRLVGMIIDEANFDRLKSSVEAGDLKAGFESAHALKGVLGNLSLTPMYDKASEITELLRAETQTDYAPMIGDLLAMRDELREMNEEA